MRRFLLILLFIPGSLTAQNTIGFPDVSNYLKNNYKAGTQNWDIKQDASGIIYFANNEGLMSYDGSFWNIYPLPNKTIVRSLEITQEGRIFVGGQDEIGYFEPGNGGRLAFRSLIPLIPEKDRSFGDVWDIVPFQSSIFFRSANKIFKYSGRTLEIFRSEADWNFLGTAAGRLFAQNSRAGWMEFNHDVWLPAQGINKLSETDPVTSVFSLSGKTIYCTTLKSGLFRIREKEFEKINNSELIAIQQQRIYAATPLSNDWIALATTLGGLFIIDKSGNLIQHFSKEEGIQNNNILCVYLDNQNNLWLGLDNGIDCIPYNSAIKHIRVNSQGGSGYTAMIHNNNLYLGTSAGLYFLPLQENEDISFIKGILKPVENTTGQNWSLNQINDQLLLGHHEGAFVVEGSKARPIAGGTGYWNFRPLSNISPTPRFIAGNYKGISLFDAREKNLELSGSVNDFPESSRYLETDLAGNFWVSHPYHGVYRITVTAGNEYKSRLFNDKNGLPNTLNNHVFKIKNEIVVATEKGIYAFNEKRDQFEPSAYFSKWLGTQSLRYLKEDTEGNIWFIHEKSMGVLDFSSKEPKVIYLAELDNKMLSGFEMLYPINPQNILLAGEDGFYHINYKKYSAQKKQPAVTLREVRISNQGDSILFAGYSPTLQDDNERSLSLNPTIDHPWKNILFKFSSPVFGGHNKIEFSYRLKGYESNWSEWSEKNEKEYTNLPAGNYRFEIISRISRGQASEPIGYSFTILAPWYLSRLAYLLYSVLTLTAIYYLIKRQRKKLSSQRKFHEEEQKRLQALHEYEISKAERELIALRNEELQTDIDFKNSELATTAMHLVQKGELIAKVKSDLTHIMKELNNEKATGELKKMIKMLSDDDKMDKDWEHFTQHFDKVHSDFVLVLKEAHSNISPNETKLCTYLRMNLSTKEIAQLMNISVRGVEISRYRLRKKLGIPKEISLFDYLIRLGGKREL